MAIGLGQLAQILLGADLTDRLAVVSIVPLDPSNNDAPLTGQTKSFQYWPESLNDRKAIEYSKRTIPGGSHPIYQPVAGGERPITMTAVFSRDIAAVDATGAPIIIQDAQLPRNVDIDQAQAWLRQYLCFDYSSSEFRLSPPAKLLLHIPNNKIGSAVAPAGGSPSVGATTVGGTVVGSMTDLILCVMTQCDVERLAWFPDGTCRLAAIQLAFEEIVQSAGQVQFIGASVLAPLAAKYQTKAG